MHGVIEVKQRRRSLLAYWPVATIAAGLAATLAWNGILVYMIVSVIRRLV